MCYNGAARGTRDGTARGGCRARGALLSERPRNADRREDSRTATKLRWQQVLAWRLAQQGIAPRVGQGGLSEAARRMVGVQAQVQSAAELALGARVDGLTRVAVQQ